MYDPAHSRTSICFGIRFLWCRPRSVSLQYRKSQPASAVTKTETSANSCLVDQDPQGQSNCVQKRTTAHDAGGIVSGEANLGRPSRGDFESMARRRFQDPRPKRRGKWWEIQVRRDEFVGGQLRRKKTRVRIAPVTVPEREARKIAAEQPAPQSRSHRRVQRVSLRRSNRGW